MVCAVLQRPDPRKERRTASAIRGDLLPAAENSLVTPKRLSLTPQRKGVINVQEMRLYKNLRFSNHDGMENTT
jgi:hypothetical protein